MPTVLPSQFIGPMPLCPHCKVRPQYPHRRGLCNKCYYRPEIRARYPIERYNQKSDCSDAEMSEEQLDALIAEQLPSMPGKPVMPPCQSVIHWRAPVVHDARPYRRRSRLD